MAIPTNNPDNLIYICDDLGNIGTVNVVTGAVTIIGNSGQVLTDLAFSANGTLYGTSFDSFYSVNRTTGLATLVSTYAGIGGNGMNALVGVGNTLYAASGQTGSLYAITAAPFSIAAVALATNSAVPTSFASGDLTSFNGSLYETLLDGSLEKITLSANGETATAITNTGISTLYGLSTAVTGVTYGISGSELYSVNLSTGTLTALLNYAGQGLDQAFGTAMLPSSALPHDDFNGDGKSDLLLQNTNGAIEFYGLNGLAVNATASVNNPGPTWHVVGEADFNGDGTPDILLQNDNGAIVDYLMNGSTVMGAYSLGSPGSGWHVRGTGDFNGDGRADILLQNDNGAMVLFDTNGTGVTAALSLGQLPAGWAIEGVGDFNGDGTPDVLVESNGGNLVDYTTNGTATGFASGGLVASLGPGWSVAGTADYNGDGRADILLHNDNGADVVFFMNGATVTGTAAFGNPGAAYQGTVTGIDINGDGTPDVVVQSASSTLVGYTLGNNAAITAAAVLNTPGAGWTLVGGNPTTFIDGTGGTLALTGTPGPDQFNLTSTAAGTHTIASFDPAQDAVALSATAFPTYAAVQMNETAYQGGTLINLSPASSIVIQGVTPAQLGSGNFVLR